MVLDVADLYRQHVRAVRRAVVAVLRRSFNSSSEDRDDVVQVTFLKVLEQARRRSLSDESRLDAYLCAIARNAARDFVRRRRREVPSAVLPDRAPDPPDTQLSPEDREFLIECVRTLAPGPLRRLYQLRFEGGLSQFAAAGVLGISRQRLRTLENRLHQVLRDGLDRRDEVKLRRAAMAQSAPLLSR